MDIEQLMAATIAEARADRQRWRDYAARLATAVGRRRQDEIDELVDSVVGPIFNPLGSGTPETGTVDGGSGSAEPAGSPAPIEPQP